MENEVNILHIFPSETFIDSVLNNFKTNTHILNDYIILTHFYNANKTVKYHNVIIKYSIKYWFYKRKLRKKKYDIIILHKYTLSGYLLVKNKITTCRVVISFFGRDNPYIKKSKILFRATNNLVNRSLFLELFSLTYYKVIYFIFLKSIYYCFIKQTIKRFSFFSTVLPFDYIEFKKHAKIKHQIYYTPIKYFQYNKTFFNTYSPISGHDIIIGNSSEFTNHIEIFTCLKGINLKDRKIILPFSYGGNKFYKQKILKEGYKIFGNRFIPLLQFVSSREYFDILSSCRVHFVTHLIQGGMGNILQSLISGRSVYFFKISPTFNYLKELGLFVFSIEENIDYHSDNNFFYLDESMIDHNRSIIESIYGRKNIYNEIFQIIS